LPKSVIGYILKKQVDTGKLENGKRAGRSRSTKLVDNQKIICIVNKNPLYDCTTSQECCAGCRHICFSSDSQKTYKKKQVEFWNKVLWTDETKVNLYLSKSVKHGRSPVA